MTFNPRDMLRSSAITTLKLCACGALLLTADFVSDSLIVTSAHAYLAKPFESGSKTLKRELGAAGIALHGERADELFPLAQSEVLLRKNKNKNKNKNKKKNRNKGKKKEKERNRPRR